jgi:GT2 family glycosyltransferase
VQFVDGDCKLVDGWLSKAHAFIESRDDLAVVCGRRSELHPTASVYNQMCDFEWNTPIGEAMACGGDALVRVGAFEAVGGFRADLIAGEEPELCVRLREKGWKIWRLDAAMTLHDAAMTRFGQYWKRAVRGGFAYAAVSQLHSSSSRGIWKKEMLRAVFWGGVLPVVICIGAIWYSAFLLGALAYPLQVIRIASAQRDTRSWIYALLVTAAKFAELQGILMFYWRQFMRRNARLIEYK